MGFIDKPHRVWWRKAIFQIHLWVGIVLTLYVVVISVSGSALVFRDEIIDDTPRLPRHEASVTPMPWGKVAALARKPHPDYRVGFIQNENWRGKALRVLLVKETETGNRKKRLFRDVYFDPFTGRMLADREDNYEKDHPVFSFIGDLHVDLLAGRTGVRVNSIFAAFLLLLCATGVVVWWPGRRIWKHGLTVKWKARWRRVNFDSHRALGFWTLLMVSMWAFTGFYFGYARYIRAAVAKVLPLAKRRSWPKTNWKPGDPVAAADRFIQSARQVFPAEYLEDLSLPSRPGDYASVRFSTNPRSAIQLPDFVVLDPRTGGVLLTERYSQEWKAGDKVLRWMSLLHYGDFSGIPVKIAWTILGLSPAILAITGFLMWWNRVLRKRWAAWRSVSKLDFERESTGEFPRATSSEELQEVKQFPP